MTAPRLSPDALVPGRYDVLGTAGQKVGDVTRLDGGLGWLVAILGESPEVHRTFKRARIAALADARRYH